MTDFAFACTGVRADPYAAGPTLVFRLRITTAADKRVHALALRCQIRIEPPGAATAPARPRPSTTCSASGPAGEPPCSPSSSPRSR